VVGDVVNLSARLMIHCEKNEIPILCDETTMKQIGSKVAFKRLKSIKVKGKQIKVKIFVPKPNSTLNRSTLRSTTLYDFFFLVLC
jgi:class 3 adenylate cyclase